MPGLLDQAHRTLSHDPIPEAAAVKAVLPLIAWHHSGLKSGKIRSDIAQQMLTAELIGPDGMIYHPSVRAGLFLQSPGLDYVTRRHTAEETFVMLGGEGLWFTSDGPGQLAHAGGMLHHPSDVPHRSVTQSAPLIAAWRWTGGIAYEDHSFTEWGGRNTSTKHNLHQHERPRYSPDKPNNGETFGVEVRKLPFVIAIITALGVVAFWIMRTRNAADAAHEILGTANNVRLAARRFRFKRKTNIHPVEAIEDPTVAVATLGVSYLELDGLPSRNHQDALERGLQSFLDISVKDAQELTVLGRWLMGECGTPQQAIARTARKLFKLDGGASFEPLMGIIQEITANGGGQPSQRQSEALDDIRRAFRLT